MLRMLRYHWQTAKGTTARARRSRIGQSVSPQSSVRLPILLPMTAGRPASRTFVFSSPNGNPILGHPYLIANSAVTPFAAFAGGSESVLLFSNNDLAFAPPIVGGTAISTTTNLAGYEANMAAKVFDGDRSRFIALIGFRGLELHEGLDIRDTYTAPAGIAAFGILMPPGTLFKVEDSFLNHNRFYGGQVGGKWTWQGDRLSASMIAKIALGTMYETADVGGTTAFITPGSVLITPGGNYALFTNSGTHTSSQFAVVPEVGLNVGYNLTQRINVLMGYTFLYCSDVARPGQQIDRTLSPTEIPSLAGPVPGVPIIRPIFSFHQTDFFAHGLNFGIEFKF
jgi:Putative beta barrel porin-7 (BBP7)